MKHPKDNVLRCAVHGTINGKTGWYIVDAFERGDAYGLVLEWSKHELKEGEFPNRNIGVPKEFFEVIPEPNSPFELRCLRSIDFDDFLSGERVELDADQIWRNPENLFYPRPDDYKP